VYEVDNFVFVRAVMIPCKPSHKRLLPHDCVQFIEGHLRFSTFSISHSGQSFINIHLTDLLVKCGFTVFNILIIFLSNDSILFLRNL